MLRQTLLPGSGNILYINRHLLTKGHRTFHFEDMGLPKSKSNSIWTSALQPKKCSTSHCTLQYWWTVRFVNDSLTVYITITLSRVPHWCLVDMVNTLCQVKDCVCAVEALVMWCRCVHVRGVVHVEVIIYNVSVRCPTSVSTSCYNMTFHTNGI